MCFILFGRGWEGFLGGVDLSLQRVGGCWAVLALGWNVWVEGVRCGLLVFVRGYGLFIIGEFNIKT